MQGLSALVLWTVYVAFCAALLIGQHAWLESQSARVFSALNASQVAAACAVAQDLGRSGLAVVFFSVNALDCGFVSWRFEVVPHAS